MRALATETPKPVTMLSPAPRRLQKACACAEKARAQEECATCSVQRKERHGAPGSRGRHSAVDAVLATAGQPLAAPVRDDMEQRFGADFSRVRIHDDAMAANAADSVDARAFTLGDHIAFAGGQYDSGSDAGRHLLAHELAHTIQQSRGGTTVQGSGGPGDMALEREADVAADAALGWRAPTPLTPAAPTIARKAGDKKQPAPAAVAKAKSAKISVGDPPKAYSVTLLSGPVDIENVTAPLVTVEVDKFYLPETKGVRAFDAYKIAPLAPLITVPADKASRVSLKQDREPTQDLRDNWLKRVNWAPDQANELWQASGGDPIFPQVGKVACHMDHVIELQLGGSGQPVNIQALDPTPNMDSGRRIRGNLADLAYGIADSPQLGLERAKGDIQLKIHFTSVAQEGTATETPCQKIETAALNNKLAKDSKRGLKQGRKLYPLMMPEGASNISVDNSLAAPIEKDDDNNPLRLAMPGMILTSLGKPAKGVHPLHARLDLETSRLPLTDKSNAKQNAILFEAGKDVAPKLKSNKTNVPIELLYLSPGKITQVASTPSGINWKGEITPTHKFLPKLEISYAEGTLSIVSGLSEDALKKASPIPGAKITKAQLGIRLMPEFKPEGTMDFELAPGGRQLMAASVSVYADEGLAAKGDVELFIPGVKSATGKVLYKQGQWSMSARVATKDLNLPYMRDGELTATYAQGKFGAEGQLNLALPGNGSGTVKLGYNSGKWLFSGNGRIGHDKFGSFSVALKDDGEEFEATGTVHPELKKLGLTPEISVTYKQKRSEAEPRITGSGSLVIARPKLNGSLKVNLLASGRFTAKGEVTYPIRPDILATLGIELDETEKVKVTGEAKLTKPIPLSPRKQGAHELKLFDVSVPIPGASIGPLGLKFGIAAGIRAGYGVGPLELRDVVVGGKIKPFDLNPDPVLDFKGALVVDANAYLGFWVRGSLIADAVAASARGSLTVDAGIEAKGQASVTTTAHYEKSAFAVKAVARAGASLDMKFTLTAGVTLSTILGDYGPGAAWSWKLGEVVVPTGLGFAFEAPASWDTKDGLHLPTPEEIKWEPPKSINAGDLLNRFLTAAKGEEPAKAPQ